MFNDVGSQLWGRGVKDALPLLSRLSRLINEGKEPLETENPEYVPVLCSWPFPVQTVCVLRTLKDR